MVNEWATIYRGSVLWIQVKKAEHKCQKLYVVLSAQLCTMVRRSLGVVSKSFVVAVWIKSAGGYRCN